MNHTELLAEAERLHVDLAVRAEELEQSVVLLTAKTTAQAQEIAALKTQISQLETEIALLKLKIKQLEDQLHPPTTTKTTTRLTTQPPPSPENYVFKETFQQPLDPNRWIFLCNDPAKNFVWVSPGNLDCVFVAGKTTGSAIDSTSGKVLRSEVEYRKVGQTTGGFPETIQVGKRYELVVDITIPTDYNPAVSDEPNEKRNLAQLWEAPGKSPWAIELIKPSAAPWNGMTNVLRVVAAGAVRWIKPVSIGLRYRLQVRTLLHASAGSIVVTLNGQTDSAYTGATTHGIAAVMVPHWGLYLPGSDDDPVGSKTRIRYHEVSIRPLA